MISSKIAEPNSSITKIPSDERNSSEETSSFFFIFALKKRRKSASSAPEDLCDGACQKGRLSLGLIGGSHLARHLTAVERGCAAPLTGHVTAEGGRQERSFLFFSWLCGGACRLKGLHSLHWPL